MQFRLGTIFYAMALLGAGVATFGAWGILWTVLILGVWAAIRLDMPKSRSQVITEAFVILAVIVFLIALLLPAVEAGRESARRASCINNLRQVTFALLLYQEQYGSLPPAYIADENGKPMHSWRVLILPILGQNDLYDAYRFDEPWDGPNNSKLLSSPPPDIYQCPSNPDPPGFTNYFAVTGPQTAWPNEKSSSSEQFTDGESNSILVFEAHGKGIHWMEPEDIPFAEAVAMLIDVDHAVVHSLNPRERFFYKRNFASTNLRYLALADGSVHAADNGWTQESAEALLTIAGGEGIGPDDIKFIGSTTWHLHWNRIFTLILFILLALLPAPWVYHQQKKAAAKATPDVA